MRGMATFATKPTAPTTERAIAMNDIRCDRTVVVDVWLDLMVSWGVNGILASTQASAVVGVVETEVCDTAAESIGASSCVGSAGGCNCLKKRLGIDSERVEGRLIDRFSR